MTDFETPRAILTTDDTAGFHCGEPTLDLWLRQTALRNEKVGASRTFVSIHSPTRRVAGYFCLSASSITPTSAPGALARNMPDPIPVVLLGRLAVDKDFSGQGVGSSLLQYAVLQAARAADIVGARTIVVQALTDSAASFYRKFGFSPFPDSPDLQYFLLKNVNRALKAFEL
ncbi:Acetyltransferase (GNAT) domain-containing protein [Paramicrobacterium humi]|uniref:Acetyltransferase (GNAT) domain-containing protein n=1 Tax=Paramicrobacterium humi TaxID=640635 RepID=A0A1H4L1D5_9MICO|nr:GNAT family N-acetyltransferase [Microbacterium humi]SEB63992.1 Acetyltransferase (GNAT) domain-containing protein [Microbacterium humi]